jgi:hypothetical protein
MFIAITLEDMNRKSLYQESDLHSSIVPCLTYTTNFHLQKKI